MARTSRTRSAFSKGEEHARLEDLWDEPEPVARPGLRDALALHGSWAFVAGRRQAWLLIAGDRFAVRFADGDIYMGAFTCSGNGRHRTLDMHVEEGPPHHKGAIAHGIYELDGDLLRWCTMSPGRPERPISFAEDDPYSLSLVFRRERAQ